MGGSQSSLPPAPLGCEYMCIAIREPDKLRIILGTDQEANIVRQIIQESWPMGIQKESFKLNGVYKFKLKGWPFETSSLTEAVHCRQMAERILHRLHRNGWHLQISCDLTQTKDLSTWFFRKVPEVTNFSSQPFLVVGLSSSDSLMVLNAPVDLHQLLKNAISKSWPSGIQKWSYENDVLLIKLKGFPWCPDGSETVHSRVVLQAIIHDLSQKQWHLYGNSNLKSTANTLFFKYEPDMSSSSVSHPLPPPWHFTLSLNSNDLLRVIDAPESLIPTIRDIIQTSWYRGIQGVSRYAGSWEFKLKGTPWWADGQETVEARILILKLMEMLHAVGWSPIASIDSSRKVSDKSSLIFRQSQPRQSPFFCLSLHKTDTLRLINAHEDVARVCQEVIQTQYVLGVQKVRYYGNSLEFKLLGNPWRCGLNGHDGIHGRYMICQLFHALAGLYWTPVISADLSAKYVEVNGQEIPVDVDSIFFKYDPAAAAALPPAFPPQAAYPLPPMF